MKILNQTLFDRIKLAQERDVPSKTIADNLNIELQDVNIAFFCADFDSFIEQKEMRNESLPSNQPESGKGRHSVKKEKGKRKPPTCSNCGGKGHQARTCDRQRVEEVEETETDEVETPAAKKTIQEGIMKALYRRIRCGCGQSMLIEYDFESEEINVYLPVE